VDKSALGQVFSEYFGFHGQFSFHRLLHTHDLPSGAGTIGQILADVPSGLSLTPPQETKKRKFLVTLYQPFVSPKHIQEGHSLSVQIDGELHHTRTNIVEGLYRLWVLVADGDWAVVLGYLVPTAPPASTRSCSRCHPVTNHTSHSQYITGGVSKHF
jgi:hypothetical protein